MLKNVFSYLCWGKIKFISEVRKFQELGQINIINSLFITNKKLIKKIIATYGNQFIVVY